MEMPLTCILIHKRTRAKHLIKSDPRSQVNRCSIKTGQQQGLIFFCSIPARQDSDAIIEAEVPEHLYRQMDLRDGDTLLARPRRAQIFAVQA